MRFAIKNNFLSPEPLTDEQTTFQPISTINIPQNPLLNRNFTFSKELQTMLTGKALLLDELPFSIETLHTHYEHGYLNYNKGIITTAENEYECQRCGNIQTHLFATFPCARCHSNCTYCRNCIMMGRVSQCTPLITWCGPPPSANVPQKPLTWDGTLSAGQQAASEKVIEAVENKKELLVWAVCGAGKTEVLFAGIAKALQQNLRVCIATPRTDVVLELAPRLQNIFQRTKMIALYGGSEDRHEYASLTISTTHQLYRFCHAFDVMIVDEVDAFPYSYDMTLKFAVQKARKSQSAIIHLTATPDQKTQQQCKQHSLNYSKISARFHRHPLPLPTFSWCGNWKKKLQKQRLPTKIKQWTAARLNQNKQALIFLPDIESLHKALPLFQKLHPDIQSVYAADPNRKEKVTAMRAGKIPILLTTTILERGVTIPGIDVAVIGAEDQTFTESALVQISGRVGRSKDIPTGTITFFHYGRTIEMVRALTHIDQMNKEGKERGLLDG